MPSLPTGTITFLFTDIEGSTRLLQQLGDRYADGLTDCRRLLRATIKERGGLEVGTEGDAVFATFPSAREALIAAVTAQQSIVRHPWPDGSAVRVRMGLHTGEARVAEGGYVGMDVHRAARICAAAHGGQILLSDAVSSLAARDLPPGVSLRDLGTHRLKDLHEHEHLFQVVHPDLPPDFPPLKSLDILPNNLPRQLTSFVGREKEMAQVKRLLSTAYLVTLTGSGGAGKTRLALQVAAEVLEEFRDGVWLAELATVSDPSLVPKAVASALDVPEQPGRGLTETLADSPRGKSALVILDNCEHLVAACAHLTTALLRTCPDLRILATSREALGHVALYQGNDRKAADLFAESLTVARDVGHKRLTAHLAGVAGVALAAGQTVRAARLVGAAEALGEATGASVEFGDRADYDRITAAVRTALDERAFQVACAEGRIMTLEQAVEYALAG